MARPLDDVIMSATREAISWPVWLGPDGIYEIRPEGPVRIGPDRTPGDPPCRIPDATPTRTDAGSEGTEES